MCFVFKCSSRVERVCRGARRYQCNCGYSLGCLFVFELFSKAHHLQGLDCVCPAALSMVFSPRLFVSFSQRSWLLKCTSCLCVCVCVWSLSCAHYGAISENNRMFSPEEVANLSNSAACAALLGGKTEMEGKSRQKERRRERTKNPRNDEGARIDTVAQWRVLKPRR